MDPWRWAVDFIALLNANAGLLEFLSLASFLPFAFLMWGSGYLSVLMDLTRRRWSAHDKAERDLITNELR